MFGCPVPERQREDGGNKNAGHDQAALAFPLNDVFDIEEQVCLDDQNCHPGEQVNACPKNKRAVLESGLQGWDQLWFLFTDMFFLFTGSQENADQRRGGNRTRDHAHQEHPPGIFRHHGANHHHGKDIGGQAAEDIENHPETGQLGAFIIIFCQFRCEGIIGHIHNGGHCFINDISERIINDQSGLAEIGAEPEQDEGKRKGERPEEQERAPAPPAGAGSVRKETNDRIIDIIPTAADKQDDRHQPRGNADHIHHKDREKGRDDGIVHAESQVTGSVDDLRPK